MKLNTKILSSLLLFGFLSCETTIEAPLNVPYAGDRMVIYGHISPNMVSLRIGRSANPNEAFVPSQIVLGEAAQPAIYTLSGRWSRNIPYDAIRDEYRLQTALSPDSVYVIKCTHPDLLEIETEPLLFAPLLENVSVNFNDEANADEENVRNLQLGAIAASGSYFYVGGLVEDAPRATNRTAAVFHDFEDAFANQCGFSTDAISQIVYSNRCFDTSFFVIDLLHFYSLSDFTNPSTVYEENPNRIGVRYGSLTEKDYRYLLSITRSRGFFDDYFSAGRVILTQTNTQNGYGWVYAVNSQDYWLDL